MATEDEPVGEQTKEDGFGKTEDVLALDGESPSAEIELEPGEELGLKVRLDRGLGDLGNGRVGEVDGSHGGEEGVADGGDGVQPTAVVGRATRVVRKQTGV